MRFTTIALGAALAAGLVGLGASGASALAGEATSGGGGGGGGTAAACPVISGVKAVGRRNGEPRYSHVDLQFSVKNCDGPTADWNVDIIFTNIFAPGVDEVSILGVELETLAAGKSSTQKWAVGGLAWRSGYRITLRVTDRATGALIATNVSSVATATPRV